MTLAGSVSTSVSSVSNGAGGTVFSSRSSGGTSRMATGAKLGAAFALSLRMTLRPLPGVEGRVAIGPYQGKAIGGGYRLVILTGDQTGPVFALERHAGGDVATLAVYDGPLRIEDGREREIRWTRDAAGRMAISIEGTEILETRDDSLSGGFDGVVLINSGGDVEVGGMNVQGND